jgi:transposase
MMIPVLFTARRYQPVEKVSFPYRKKLTARNWVSGSMGGAAMAQGHRKTERQSSMWVATSSLPRSAAHPFYQQLNEILVKHGFDRFVDELTAPFYEDGGRPGIPVGNYFRMMMVGFFEDIGSERGIAWRVADSLSLRLFLGLDLSDETPDHSTLGVIRHRLPQHIHHQAFQFVVALLAREGQIKGKTLGIDATTVEANAARRELQRKDTKERYDRYVRRLAEAAGEPASTAEEVARFDRQRKGKKCSNEDWEHPHDPDARLGRDKHGATDMLYKLEKADDLDTGAIVAVTVQTADTSDLLSLDETLMEADHTVSTVMEDPRVAEAGQVQEVAEVVADKGYHSNATCRACAELGVRTYFSEMKRGGRRRWKGLEAERDAVYANRRRIRGERGKQLRKLRAEISERNFAHLCDTGGQRRTFLRGLENVTKKALLGAMGFNLALLLRQVFGLRKPRQLGGAGGGHGSAFGLIFAPAGPIFAVWRAFRRFSASLRPVSGHRGPGLAASPAAA